jgi:hypothetical protein
MYIADLDLCRYHSGPFDAGSWAVPLLAVGWLDRNHAYSQGQVTSELMFKFVELAEQFGQAYAHVRFRGLHVCSFCDTPDVHPFIKNSCDNVFIPGKGVVYVATSGTSHYMQAHSYTPPLAFIDAVLCCPEVTSEDYGLALIQANAGKPIPLKPYEPSVFRTF